MGVTLPGKQICATAAEALRLRAALPENVRLMRAEAGFVSFDLTQSDDPLVRAVAERFADAAACEAHQTHTASADRARETAGIARDYTTSGLE